MNTEIDVIVTWYERVMLHWHTIIIEVIYLPDNLFQVKKGFHCHIATPVAFRYT